MPHIFIIEQQREIRSILERILCRAGYTVSTFSDAGLAQAYARKTPPSAVVVDMSYQPLTISQALAALRASLPDRNVPFIVTSTWYCDEVNLLPGDGYAEILVKPFLRESLLESIERALWQHQRPKQHPGAMRV